ncbi:hypothetical protein GcM3_017023 [Golovinomyces cichoracearum]|uniref:Transposable element tc3 transposase n=1 Tax=Golovinomyces cichoracearum TaxID=62708 RepID=A0A420J8G2_9PEZI|nr:hypothetical protein GcM3_017023 [Golovinomyces cichoracearum]
MSTTNLLSQRRRNYISSEDCIRVKTLRKHTNKTIEQIAKDLGLSWHQVQHVCARHSESPSVRTGRPPVLSSQQIDQLVAFVRSSYEARRMSYLDLSLDPFREWNKTKRIEFAQTHINWSLDDWSRVLWTDETWATGNPHRNTWVTRLVNTDAI